MDIYQTVNKEAVSTGEKTHAKLALQILFTWQNPLCGAWGAENVAPFCRSESHLLMDNPVGVEQTTGAADCGHGRSRWFTTSFAELYGEIGMPNSVITFVNGLIRDRIQLYPVFAFAGPPEKMRDRYAKPSLL